MLGRGIDGRDLAPGGPVRALLKRGHLRFEAGACESRPEVAMAAAA